MNPVVAERRQLPGPGEGKRGKEKVADAKESKTDGRIEPPSESRAFITTHGASYGYASGVPNSTLLNFLRVMWHFLAKTLEYKMGNVPIGKAIVTAESGYKYTETNLPTEHCTRREVTFVEQTTAPEKARNVSIQHTRKLGCHAHLNQVHMLCGANVDNTAVLHPQVDRGYLAGTMRHQV